VSTEQEILEQLRQRTSTAAATTGTEPDFTKRESVWTIDVTEPGSGKRFVGTFTSQVPSLRGQDEIALLAAQLAGGVAYQAIAPAARYRMQMFAAFTVMLLKRPDWFSQPAEFLEEDVPLAVYDRMTEHIQTFFRRRAPQAGGAAADAGVDQHPPAVAG